MPARVSITFDDISVEAELFETDCAKAVASALPIRAIPREWGDEFYFSVAVEEELDETAAREVRVGDIGYWPPGKALAVFFGPTPASTGEAPVAASEVNIVGRITGDAALLREARGARSVVMDLLEGRNA